MVTLNFVSTNYVIILVLLYSISNKIEQTSWVVVKFNSIFGIDDLRKLGKEYLTALKCKLRISF